MARKPDRPPRVYVGPTREHPVRLCARPVRGPSKSDPRWYWRAVVYEDGAERTVWTGRGTPEEVTLALAEVLRTGGYRPEEQASEVVVLETVGDLLSYWLGAQDQRQDLAEATLDVYHRHSRALHASLGDVRIEDVDLRALEGHRDRRLQAGRAPATVLMDLRVLRIAWKWGHAVGACPTERLPPLRINKRAVRSRYTPRPADVARLLAVLERWTRRGRRAWPAWGIRLHWASGMRVGEIGQLWVPELDLAGAKIYLHRTKTRHPRTVHLRPEFCEEFRAWVETRPPDGPLWPVKPKTFRVRINQLLREACAAAGLPHWSSHGFRRAAVTRWLRAGAGLRTGSAQFGHSISTMVRIYQEIEESDAEDAVTLAALDVIPPDPEQDR